MTHQEPCLPGFSTHQEFFLRAVSGNELEYVLSEPDAEFLQRFDTGELAFAEWTHEAHCRLAFVLYRHHQYDQTAALQAIRAEILKFNQAHRERLTVGYHETLTTFWALAVFMGEDSRPRRLDFASFWVPPVRAILSNTNLWQTFYSAERMWNGNAATTVVPPDRQPLSGLISTFRSAGSSQLTE